MSVVNSRDIGLRAVHPEGRVSGVPATSTVVRQLNPRDRGGRLRHEIMAGAAAILERTGNENDVTLRAVAREIGISARSIDRHFASPAEIVDAVVADQLAALARRSTPQQHQAPTPPKASSPPPEPTPPSAEPTQPLPGPLRTALPPRLGTTRPSHDRHRPPGG